MRINWGRKGVLAGALAVSFVTPVVAPVSNTINEVQHRPSHKVEVRHITPVAVSGTGLNRVQIRPDSRFEYRHITPSAEIVAEAKTHPFRGKADRDRILAEDQELIELITILASVDGI